MAEKPENLQAFPRHFPDNWGKGMKLRDYYATHAPEMPHWHCSTPENPCSRPDMLMWMAVSARWKYDADKRRSNGLG